LLKKEAKLYMQISSNIWAIMLVIKVSQMRENFGIKKDFVNLDLFYEYVLECVNDKVAEFSLRNDHLTNNLKIYKG